MDTTRRTRRAIAGTTTLCVLSFCALISPANAGTGRVRTQTGTRLLDFCVSVRFDATPVELDNIERALTDANEVLADATDGQVRFGRIDIVNGGGAARQAEIWIKSEGGSAYATCGLYGTPGEHVTMYYPNNFSGIPSIDGDAFTLAHELAHHVWGLKDEYIGPAGPADCEMPPGSPTADFSLMDNYFARGGNDGSGTGTYTLDEFCVSSNHDPDEDTGQTDKWLQSCWGRLASHPTRALAAPVGLPEAARPVVPAPTFRTPAGDRRFVFCLDRSADLPGAGSPLRLAASKIGAALFVDLVTEGDKVGITSFASDASVDFELTAIQSPADRLAAKLAVAGLTSEGATAIGSGLARARDLLAAEANISCDQTIILLTDGHGNTGPSELSLIPSLLQLDISVIAVAIGEGARTQNLRTIAQKTGGQFFVVPNVNTLPAVLAALSAELAGGGVAASEESTVQPGQEVSVPVLVDVDTQRCTFALLWPDLGDDLELSLVSPTGNMIDPSDAVGNPDIDFIGAPGAEILVVGGGELEDGGWTALVTNSNGVDEGSFCLGAYNDTDGISFNSAVGQPEYAPGDPILVMATPRFQGNAVLDTNVGGTFTAPDGSTGLIALFDDGNPVNGDDVANDGTYSALLGTEKGVGVYSFDLSAENVSGMTFGGETMFQLVGAPPFSEPAPAFVRLTTSNAVVTEEGDHALSILCQDPVDIQYLQGGGAEVTLRALVERSEHQAVQITWTVGDQVAKVDHLPAGATSGETWPIVKLTTIFPPGFTEVTVTADDGEEVSACGTSVNLDGQSSGPPTGAPEVAALTVYRPSPNPFRTRIRLAFAVPTPSSVRIDVYDVAGRRVRELLRTRREAGLLEVEWDGRNGNGHAVPSGVYFFRAVIGGEERVLRVTRIR